MKTYFLPVSMEIEIDYEDILRLCNKKKVSVCSPIQYLNEVKKIKEFLIKNGIEVISKRCLTTGEYDQVLGCDVSACNNNVDLILYVGDGKFHPLWIAYKVKKPVYVVIEKRFIDENEIRRLRNYIKYAKTKLEEANKIGIIVSLKPGQNRIELANNLKKKFNDKHVYIFLMDNVDPNELNDFDVDIWINTACPRILDDREKFFKPIINVGEL